MWVVIHMAKSRSVAEKMRRALEDEGLMVQLRPVYKKVDEENNFFEVLVLKSEADEGRTLLMELGF